MNVSIIIPVYQVELYIEDCLKSVVSQSYQGEMECLLIDDCGTDNSIGIAERIIKEYYDNLDLDDNLDFNGKTKGIRFQILHHEHNRGLSAARNTGLEAAQGDYIFFLDSDDTITKNCIELLMERVTKNPQVEMVQGNVETYPFKNLENMTFKVRMQEAFTNDDVRNCFFKYEQLNTTAWNKLINRLFLIKNDIWFDEGILYEDMPWVFKLLKHLDRVCFVPEITYRYNRREDSIVTGTVKKEKAESFIWTYRKIFSDLTPDHEREEITYYGKKFSYFCARFSREVPEFLNDIKEWQQRAKVYGSWNLRMRLSMGKMLSGTQYGWLLLSLLYRLEHPRVIPSDVQRIWNKVERKMK